MSMVDTTTTIMNLVQMKLCICPSHAHDHDNRPNHWADETGAQKRGRPLTNGQLTEEMQRQDVPLADESGDVRLTTPMTAKQPSSMAKRVLAIVSLLMGVVMMILVGIGE
jgi:hypothetical protein